MNDYRISIIWCILTSKVDSRSETIKSIYNGRTSIGIEMKRKYLTETFMMILN